MSDVSYVRAAGCGGRLHEKIEPSPLARNQELGRGIIEALALQLPDGGSQLEDLGAQLQNPVSVRSSSTTVALHQWSLRASAAREPALALQWTKTPFVANVRQHPASTRRLPFADQQAQFPAQIDLRLGTFSAVAIAIDEIAHGRLDIGHLQPQGADLASNFINSVVHGLLEQNKNI
ncbi:hypothetical protein [Bradyrhizobium guangdongense]